MPTPTTRHLARKGTNTTTRNLAFTQQGGNTTNHLAWNCGGPDPCACKYMTWTVTIAGGNWQDTGSLTRTSDTQGSITVTGTPQCINNGKADVAWSAGGGGSRTAVDTTISGSTVSFSGGSGDVLPAATTTVTVTRQENISWMSRGWSLPSESGVTKLSDCPSSSPNHCPASNSKFTTTAFTVYSTDTYSWQYVCNNHPSATKAVGKVYYELARNRWGGLEFTAPFRRSYFKSYENWYCEPTHTPSNPTNFLGSFYDRTTIRHQLQNFMVTSTNFTMQTIDEKRTQYKYRTYTNGTLTWSGTLTNSSLNLSIFTTNSSFATYSDYFIKTNTTDFDISWMGSYTANGVTFTWAPYTTL